MTMLNGLVTLGFRGSLKDRAMLILVTFLMLVDCLVTVLTLGFVNTVFAAPLIMKRHKAKEAKIREMADKMAREVGEALKRSFAKGQGITSEEVTDWCDIISRKDLKSSKDN